MNAKGQSLPDTTVIVGEAAAAGSACALIAVDDAGTIVAVNDAGQHLAQALAGLAADNGFRKLLERVIADRSVGQGRIDAPGAEERDGVTYDLTVLAQDGGGALIIGKDASLGDALRLALTESRQRFKDLVEISADFAWEVDATGTFIFVSPRGALGYPAAKLVGRDPTAFLLHGLEDAARSPFKTDKKVDGVEVWMQRADGTTACLRATAMPLIDADGTWTGARGVCRDVTEDRERESALARARNRERVLTYIVRSFRDEMDLGNMLSVAAEAICKGLSADGCQILHAQAPEGGAEEPVPIDGEFRRPAAFHNATTYGVIGGIDEQHAVQNSLIGGADHLELSLGPFHVLASATRFQRRINGAVVLWRDASKTSWTDDDRILIDDIANQIAIASEQVAVHLNILRISRTDALTGLFNRRAFFGEVDRHFNRLKHDNKPAALLYVDLDNFKAVNDTFGHQRGDDVLLEVRALLTDLTRPTDLIARLGGDEFAVWLDGADERIAREKCEALLTGGRERLTPLSASADKPLLMSIGVAVFDPKRLETRENLIKRADDAMYRVKSEGKGSFSIAPAAAKKGKGAS